MKPVLEPSSVADGGIRKRVCKACDRCRLKKSKCDGTSPCNRCETEGNVCVFDGRKKSLNKGYSKAYVEMLENQQSELVDGLQELYKRMQDGYRWVGFPLKTTGNAIPSANEILEHLRIMKEDSKINANFRDDLKPQHPRLVAGEATMMETESHIGGTSLAPFPAYELQPSKFGFPNPAPMRDFPPTPNESPPLQSFRTAAQHEAESYFHAATQQTPTRSTHVSRFANGKQVIDPYDTTTLENGVDLTPFTIQMDYEQAALSVVSIREVNDIPQFLMICPKASSPEWQPEDTEYADSWIAVTSQDSYGRAS